MSLTDSPSAEPQTPRSDTQVSDEAFFDSACLEINRIHEEYLSGRLDINDEHRRGLVEISQLLLDIDLPPDEERAARLLVVSRQMADLLTAEAPTTQVPVVVVDREEPAAVAGEVQQPPAAYATEGQAGLEPVPDTGWYPQQEDPAPQEAVPAQSPPFPLPQLQVPPQVSPQVSHLPAPDTLGREGVAVEQPATPVQFAQLPPALPAEAPAQKTRWGKGPKAEKAPKPAKAPKPGKTPKAEKAPKAGKAPKPAKPGKAPKPPKVKSQRRTRPSVVALLIMVAIAGGLGYAAYKDRSLAAKDLAAQQAQTALNSQLAPQMVTVEKDLASVNAEVKSLDAAITALGNGVGSHGSSQLANLHQIASAAGQTATALQQCVASTIGLQASFSETLSAGGSDNVAPAVAKVAKICSQSESDAQVLQADLPSGS